MTSLRLGTRGSALALVQANLVKALLEKQSPGLRVELVTIKTTGDRISEQATPPPVPSPSRGEGQGGGDGKGIFIKEIEEALLNKTVDLAVHSLKDLPTELTPALALGAILEREDPRDCLVSRFGEQLLELPRGAVVGTGSPRRRAQLRAAKKGLVLEDMRGNLDTRLRKVMEGTVSAIVVAHAGVKRLGRQDEVSEVLDFDVMLPAPGQGFIAVEIREDDRATRERVAALEHAPSARASEAERAFLAGLGGGCRVPIAAYAREAGGELILDGLVVSPDGKKSLRDRWAGPAAEGAALGRRGALGLIEKGALQILPGVPGN